MSRFFSNKYATLKAYVPGEQPKDCQYIKLNTNESPFPPSPKVFEAVQAEAGRLQLYSDPESSALSKKAAETYGVKPTQVLATNGSDEALNFAFMAFCDRSHPIVFPDVTYGFYPVIADLNAIPYETIPLKEDFTVDYRDYVGLGKHIVIANPNAPTGLCLSLLEVEEIVKSNPDNVVIIDEAYVDFGGESAVSLVDKYDNLLVVQTFSKSRSLAGGRLGFAIGNEKLIADLNTLKYSTNPYNVNRMTSAAGIAVLEDRAYFENNCRKIQENREYTSDGLKKMGFTVLDSKANFLFAKTEKISGRKLYEALKAEGVLVRHFQLARISDFIRVTIGAKEEMEIFLQKTKKIIEEQTI